MESNELKIFMAVAQEGSITKAAQRLGYVQSNVTARIQLLESEVNTQLFYRQHGMLLTPMGKKLVTYAEQILHLLDEANKTLNDLNDPTGQLSIGVNNTVSSLNILELLSNYHNLYPKVKLSLSTSSTDELIEKVLHYDMDVAFVKASSIKNPNIVNELIFEENLVMIYSGEESDIYSLCHRSFLMSSPGCPNRTNIENWLTSIGICNISVIEFNNLDLIIEGVISGLGVSFVPESYIQKQKELGLLKVFPIPTKYSSTRTFLIRHKNNFMTSTLSKFIELVQFNMPIHKPKPSN